MNVLAALLLLAAAAREQGWIDAGAPLTWALLGLAAWALGWWPVGTSVFRRR